MLASGVQAGYGESPVLNGVSLEAHEGQTVALLGPNGCGKTTLLKCLCGAMRPWAGKVELLGADVALLDNRALAKLVAYVPQSEDHAFDFTVREVVLMGRLAHSDGLFETPDDASAAERAMTTADCLDFADRPLSTLSGGEAQRALIARALAQETRLLLCDEPATHLDPRHQVEVLRVLTALRLEGRTVIVSTHDLNWAMAASDTCVLMSQGTVAFAGPLEEAVAQNLHEVVYQTGFAKFEHEGGLRLSAV